MYTEVKSLFPYSWGNQLLTEYGNQFLTEYGNQFLTEYGNQFLTEYGNQLLTEYGNQMGTGHIKKVRNLGLVNSHLPSHVINDTLVIPHHNVFSQSLSLFLHDLASFHYVYALGQRGVDLAHLCILVYQLAIDAVDVVQTLAGSVSEVFFHARGYIFTQRQCDLEYI